MKVYASRPAKGPCRRYQMATNSDHEHVKEVGYDGQRESVYFSFRNMGKKKKQDRCMLQIWMTR